MREHADELRCGDLAREAEPISAETFGLLPPEEIDRLLSIMSRFPPGIRADFERAAIDKLLVSDFASAYAYAAALSAEGDRDVLLKTFVSNHTQFNAREALTHILTVNRPPLFAIDSVLAAIAAEDFAYAFDQAIESLVSGSDQTFNEPRLAVLTAATSGRSRAEIAAAVELVAYHPDQRVRRQLNGMEAQAGVLTRWAEVDPEGAANWAILNPPQVSPAVIEALGKKSASASGNVASAEALYRLPDELRGYWIAGVAEVTALEWLGPVRGTPVYATAVNRVLISASSVEPEAVLSQRRTARSLIALQDIDRLLGRGRLASGYCLGRSLCGQAAARPAERSRRAACRDGCGSVGPTCEPVAERHAVVVGGAGISGAGVCRSNRGRKLARTVQVVFRLSGSLFGRPEGHGLWRSDGGRGHIPRSARGRAQGRCGQRASSGTDPRRNVGNRKRRRRGLLVGTHRGSGSS